MEFLPSFGGFGLTILAFVVALTIIVFVHEFGHYIVGRWSGIRADVFSVGMGPALWSRTDRRGTVWQIAAFPVGGYVKFAGDANAASGGADEEALSHMSAGERRHTMPGAPLWARASTVAAGPVFNFILSIVVFSGFIMIRGVATEPLTVAELRPMPGIEGTLQPGDELIEIAGRPVPGLDRFSEFVENLPEDAVLDYLVRRDGREVLVAAPHPFPPFVGGISPKSAAVSAGVQKYDLIETVNGVPVATFDQLRDIVGHGGGAALTLGIDRGGEKIELTLAPRRMDLPNPDGGFETRWLIGITSGTIFEPMSESPGVWPSVQAGVQQTWFVIKSSMSGLWHMVAGKISTCNLSGPIGIAQTSGVAASQGISNFVWFVAVLSTAVGLLNLFPIPILDGGHLVFHGWEALTGRTPGDMAMRILLAIGLALILTLLIVGTTADLFC